MRTQIPFRFASLVLGLALRHDAGAQTTSISYQGRLDDAGAPATGNYDFQFYLRDADTGGNPVGTTNTLAPVGVTNGLFSVTLDFGNAPFAAGALRWLEVAVRTNGSLAAYLALTPRQPLLSVPYALTASNLTGTLPGNRLSGIYSSAVTLNNAANSFSGNGSGLTGLNASSLNSGTLADARLSANVALLDHTQTFTGNNSFGNVSVNSPATLSFGAKTRQMINLYGAPYGIGVQPYTHYLRTDAGASFAWYEAGVHTNLFQDPGPGGARLMTLSSYGGLALENSSQTFKGLAFDDRWGALRFDSENSYFLRARSLTATVPNVMAPVFLVRGDGNTGLGTDNPLAKLEIQGGAGWDGSSDPKAISLAWGGGGYRHWIRTRHNGSSSFDNAIDFYVNSATTAEGSSRPGVGNALTLSLNGGNVGVGIAEPQSRLHVAVPATASPLAAMQLEVGSFTTFTNATNSAFLTVRDVGSGKMAFYIRGDGNVGIGTSDPRFPLDVVGMTRTCVLQIKGGCDIAEPFEMSDAEIPRGALVRIDDENAGKLKLAGQEYDTRVAGIVSGAKGVNPGISLSQEGVMDSGQNVALSGRVYALADASYGAIKPGDLLTSSGTPGHVMKVTDHARAQGAIVGKAMSGLKDGRGMVLVLVTLQ